MMKEYKGEGVGWDRRRGQKIKVEEELQRGEIWIRFE